MPQSEKQPPFALLGKQLRSLRETRRESVAEVSGAVEIDPELLERFERGEECPSEDILTLLISHFDMREQDAMQLWEWAGLAGPKGERLSGEQLQEAVNRAALVVVAMIDARALYASHSAVQADMNGLVVQFTQSTPQGPMTAARIGMSYEHAAELVRTLERALLRRRYVPPYPLLSPGSTDPKAEQ